MIWLPEVRRYPGAIPPAPGSVADASEMLNPGVATASSSVMVAVATARERVAPEGLERVTVRVSAVSTVVSPLTATTMVWEVTPGVKVRVPAALV